MRVITKAERAKIIELLKKKTPINMISYAMGMNSKYITIVRNEEGIPKNKPTEIKRPSKSMYNY